MGCIVGQGGPADEADSAPFRTEADLDPVVDAANLPTVLGPVDPNQDAFRSLLDLDTAGLTIDDEAEPHGHLPRGVAVARPQTTPTLSAASGRRSDRTSIVHSRRPPRRFPRSAAPTARGFGFARRAGGRPPSSSRGFP